MSIQVARTPEREEAPSTPVSTLPDLRTPMWDHQATAFARAATREGFLLAHDMGTGKSLTAIALLEADRAERVLILCPRNVQGVWPHQLAAHSTRDWHTWAGRVQGSRGPVRHPRVPERAAALLAATADAQRLGKPLAAAVNYEAAWRPSMRAALESVAWDAVICDESHRLKKPSGKASRLAAELAARTRSRGGRVLCLTGTPMPHTPLDMWAQMRVIDGGQRLGQTYRGFCARYAKAEEIRIPGGRVRTIHTGIRPDMTETFAATVGEVCDRVAAADVLDLPPVTDRRATFALSPPVRRAYDDLERHGIAEAEGGTLTAANAMVLVLRLAQASSGFGVDVDSGRHVTLTPGRRPDRAQALADVLYDLPPDEPIVVFCRFIADLEQVAAIAREQGRRYGELSGRRRDGITERSTMSEDIDVLGAQVKSGGVGIDLTRARIGVYYSLDFSLAEHAQSRARLVRPGQERPVTLTHLLAEDSIDWAVLGALRKRQEVVDAVIAHLRNGGSRG